MKNHPQDGSNRKDRQQDPNEIERRDFTPNRENRPDERRQQDPGVRERREMTPNPGDRQEGSRQQDPRRTERQDTGSNPGARQGGTTGGQQGTDRPNTQQKFPGGKDRPETERAGGDRDTQGGTRRQGEKPDSRDEGQEPYMGRKHEE